MKKIIWPEGPAKKIILLRFCPKKIPSAPPPEYQMNRALTHGHKLQQKILTSEHVKIGNKKTSKKTGQKQYAPDLSIQMTNR